MQVGRQVECGRVRKTLVVQTRLAGSAACTVGQLIKVFLSKRSMGIWYVIVWHRHRLASSSSGIASVWRQIAIASPSSADLCWSIALHHLNAANTCHRIASHRHAEDPFLIASPRRILNPCVYGISQRSKPLGPNIVSDT